MLFKTMWGTVDSAKLVLHSEILILLLDLSNVPNASNVQICKQSFLSCNLNFTFLFCSHTMWQQDFGFFLQHFLFLADVIHVVFGDIDIDALEGINSISKLFLLIHYDCEYPYTYFGFIIRPSKYFWRTPLSGWGE